MADFDPFFDGPPDARALLERIRPELDAVDLLGPLPYSVLAARSIAMSNGEGIEPTDDSKRLAVLAARGVITTDEAILVLNELEFGESSRTTS